MKKLKVILALLLVVLIAVAAIFATGVLDIRRRTNEVDPKSGNYATSTVYTDFYQMQTSVQLPLMKTDFENIFFTMTKQGEVVFYQVIGGSITPLAEAGSYEVTATCSAQPLTATIHYIEQDGHTFGCGLFTNLMRQDVLFYDYAFFKVTDMFEKYTDTNGVNYYKRGAKLLLIDTDSARFYSDEKVYSEAFVLNEDHSTSIFLSNDQRAVGMDAREKSDYKMFTDDILDQNTASNVLFFSSRYYVEYTEGGKVDIFTSGGSGTNIDNVRYIMEVDGLYFWNYEGDTYFFRKDQENPGQGEFFTLTAYNQSSKEVRPVNVFSGNLENDYIVRGPYIFSKKTGHVMNVLTGDNYNLPYTAFGITFAADLFDISENGRYCAVRGIADNNKVGCGVMDLATGTMVAYKDDVFANIANMNVLNDGTVMLSVAEGENAAVYYQLTAVIPNTAAQNASDAVSE
ncbi:MAG: hypothetical protein IJR51_11250 [Clostridia bacterium]|nr:hypothetical protein [Clostridia bacterium]MBQ9507721.1 hypothetical protein [Clostridia bacterium]MBR5424001.1 hypothetical protein [Clostridia bacterium]